MASEIQISITGDSAQLDASLKRSADVIASAMQNMRGSFSGTSPEVQKLQQSIDQLNESMRRTADNTGTLATYANWSFALKALGVVVDGVVGSINLLMAAQGKIIDVNVGAVNSVVATTESYFAYARSIAYVGSVLPMLEVANTGVSASIGRASVAWQEFWRWTTAGGQAARQAALDSVAAAGNMDEFAKAVQAATGQGQTKFGLQDLIFQLTKIPGLTEQDASSILGMFGSITGISAPLLNNLVSITQQMSMTREGSLAMAADLTRAMQDPATAGQAWLESQKDINAEMLNSFDFAKRDNDILAMRAIIMEEMIQKEKALLEARLREKEENAKLAPGWDFNNRDISFMKTALAALDEQLAKLRSNNVQMMQGDESLKQSAIDARNIVNALNPLANQIDIINAKLKTMGQNFSGLSNISLAGVHDTSSLIARFEGVSLNAYQDHDTEGKPAGYAIGYGSHKMLDGSDVTANSVITLDEALQLLNQRSVEFANTAANTVGPAWTSLSDRVKSALTSVTYNYGHLPDSVAAAARTGNESEIANAIRSLGANPGRRNAEADYIMQGAAPGSDTRTGAGPAQVEAYNQLLSQERALQNLQAGGNAIDAARADILQRTANGQRDEVRDAKEMVDAWRIQLSQETTAEGIANAKRNLSQAEANLAKQELAVNQAQLETDKADATTKEAKLKVIEREHALALQAAGQDQAARIRADQQYEAAKAAIDAQDHAMEVDKENASFELALASLQQKRLLLRDELQAHTITADAKLQKDLQLDDQQTQLEQAHYQKLKNWEDQGSLAYQQAQEKLTLVAQQEATRRQQIMAQDAKQEENSFQGMASSIAGSFHSAIMGMINGTMTFRQAVMQIGMQVVDVFVKMGTDMLQKWIETLAQQLMHTIANQTQQTGAVVAGTGARVTAQAAGAAAGAAAEKAGNAATISQDAGKAAAGAYSAVAGIPIIGPILAPAAAAVAFGAVEAFGVFDSGAWQLSHDQLAYVHAGEMIVPTKGGLASEFRSLLSGDLAGPSSRLQQPSGATHVHLSVSAIDSSGFKNLVMNHGSMLAAEIARQMNANLTLRPKY